MIYRSDQEPSEILSHYLGCLLRNGQSHGGNEQIVRVTSKVSIYNAVVDAYSGDLVRVLPSFLIQKPNINQLLNPRERLGIPHRTGGTGCPKAAQVEAILPVSIVQNKQSS